VVVAITIAGIDLILINTGRFQDQVRNAEIARTNVLELQFDEETGLRGFTSTNSSTFLQPYIRAALHIYRAFENLKAALAPIDANGDLSPYVATEETIHRQWLADIAKPLIRNDRRHDALSLQVRGKDLMDRFRAADAELEAGLIARGNAADQALRRAVQRIILIGGITLLVAIAVVLDLSLRADRLAEQSERQRRLYTAEKEVTDELQRALLPSALPTVPNLRIDALYRPAGELSRVGGDWYDAIALPDGRLFVTIGDVTGQGVAAAAAMNGARQALLAAALREDDPGAILMRANRALLLQGSSIVTAACAFIDPKTLSIVYATAGHPPPVMIHPLLGPQLLPHGGIPLGAFNDARYATFAGLAVEGALLILYTDGLTERSHDVVEGEALLLEAASALLTPNEDFRDERSPAFALYRSVFHDAAPADDVAILTVAFGPADPQASLT
jgi:serine phosphatase RsbU (regulator of sigma subunit)